MMSGTSPSVTWKKLELLRIEFLTTPYVVALCSCSGPRKEAQWWEWVSRVWDWNSVATIFKLEGTDIHIHTMHLCKDPQFMVSYSPVPLFACLPQLPYTAYIYVMPQMVSCNSQDSVKQGCLQSPKQLYLSVSECTMSQCAHENVS